MDNIREINLWNLTDGKTREVVRFVSGLSAYGSTRDANRKFYEIKARALAQVTPDAMLETIGYRYGNRPRIYEVTK